MVRLDRVIGCSMYRWPRQDSMVRLDRMTVCSMCGWSGQDNVMKLDATIEIIGACIWTGQDCEDRQGDNV